MVGRVPTKTLLARDISHVEIASFWALVDMKLLGCWEWKGQQELSKRPTYGRHKINGKRYAAHRISYAMVYGGVTEDDYVCHKCDNPECVRPDHLFIGDARINADDRVRKNRQAKGSSVGSAVLTEAQVVDILADTRFHRVIAADYGVAKSTISKIKARVNWRHLSPVPMESRV